MQTDLLFFQSLPDDLSVTLKKEFQNSDNVNRPAGKGALTENSVFLSKLRQIANQPLRSWENSDLFKSLGLAPEPLQTNETDSNSIIQGRPVEELAWLNFIVNYALGSQNPEDDNGPASKDINVKSLLVSFLKDFDPVACQAHNGRVFSDPVSQVIDSGTIVDAPLAHVKNQILNILNLYQEFGVPGLSAQSASQVDESDADAARLLSVLNNRIIDLLKMNPNAQPSDLLAKTDPELSAGINEKNPLPALISVLMHWRGNNGSMPPVQTLSDNFQLPDPAINPESPDSDNGRNVQALLVKLLSYFRSGENGIGNHASAPSDRSTGIIYPENVTADPPNTHSGNQISQSAPEKIIPDPGGRHNEKDNVSRLGLDVTQQIKNTSSGEIAEVGKNDAATHLKAAVAVPQSSNPRQSFDEQSARDGDVKTDLFRGTPIESAPSETGSLSSEAEKDSHDFKDPGPRINFGDIFTREDAGDKTARVIPENGEKASPSTSNRVSESFSETSTSAKDPDPITTFSRTGALNQIVEKAALNLKNEQSEIRLNLKPEFLGRVHMRILTENQQVTLKISTEFFAVKDIIENNIHQLKADLQNHGLEINSLDVSVTKDSHQQGSGHHPSDLLKEDRNAGTKSGSDDPEQTALPDPNVTGGENGSDKAIDYFA